ncbi:MAG: hypothetical protein GY775_10705 [Candidatus Scalindua sp.]|nr:hypothetical protein [Candidatus Scalindua sp.]
MKKKETNLLDQFFVTLNVTYQQVQESNQNLNEHSGIRTKIEEMLQGEKSWRNAYQIEQLMVPLFIDEGLDIELTRRILEGKKLEQDVFKYYESSSQVETNRGKQALLGRLINDLQWFYEISRIKQTYIKRACLTVNCAFMASILLFFLPDFFPVTDKYLDNIGDQTTGIYIYIAMNSGAMGATFSMLMGLNSRFEKSSLDGLRMLQRWNYVITRYVAGLGSGLVIYYFFKSGLLEGSLFPDFVTRTLESGVKVLDLEPTGSALLIIWCFLSGFSEKLVPNILSKTEKKANMKAAD